MMDSDRQQRILEKQKKRFEVLKFIYDDTDGEEHKVTVAHDIIRSTSVPMKELEPILEYLQHEGLIKGISFLGDSSASVRILHKGVIEVEAAISRPQEPTEHFPQQIFNITNNALVTAQQYGNQNTINISERSNLAEAAAEIQQLLNQLEQSYPTATFSQKAVLVEEAVKQIESNPSLKSRVVGALKSAGVETFKEAIDHPLVNILMAAIEGWQVAG